MKHFKSIQLSLLLLITALLSSCISEDLSDCPTGLRVFFSYTSISTSDESLAIDEEEVEEINLFAFDENGILRGMYIDEKPRLAPNYCMTIDDLPTGNYHFVAWCGVLTPYNYQPSPPVVGQTKLTDEFLQLAHDDEYIASASPLFHALKDEWVNNTSNQDVYLPLKKIYNKINLTTEGLANNAAPYQMTVTDNNGKYDFDCAMANDDLLQYTTPCAKDADGQLLATLNTLKLANDHHPILAITNTNTAETLFLGDLIELFTQANITDLENTHIFNIHLKFIGPNVSVRINDWLVVDDGGINLN